MQNDTITTLVVKHLPEFITSSTELQSKYFRSYQPIDARFMQSQAMMGFVFLDFANRDKAEIAFKQLKLINFGLYFKPVQVEYAKPDPNQQYSIEPVKLTIEEHEQAANPISASQGILYPPNPHLRYFYPDPTPDIITNISNAMASVPRFYTQILHLMNKYNMPPPFGPIDKESIPSILKRKHDDLLASDESELEDEEELDAKMQEEKVKQARLGRITAEKQRAIATATVPSKPVPQQQPNKIKININKTIKIKENNDISGDELNEDQKSIREKCRPMAELTDLPGFKNYTAGHPSNKLYVKNLYSKVTQQDLIDLFSKFHKDIEVNLMTKGRLKGQAFITFPDEKSATLALGCTNGYILSERPMAVQFGKSNSS